MLASDLAHVMDVEQATIKRYEKVDGTEPRILAWCNRVITR